MPLRTTWLILRVGLQVCAVTLLALIVAFQLEGLAGSILPPALGCEVSYWTQLLLFGIDVLLGGCNEPWSWTQIPETLAYLGTIVLLIAVGWILVRSRQGYPIRLLGWAPRIQPKRLVWALFLTGAIYPAIHGVMQYSESYYPYPVERLADSLGVALFHTIPHFLAGCFLAWLVKAPKAVWLAGLLGFLIGPSAMWTLYFKMHGKSWYPLFMAITGILVATGIVAFGYALRSSFRDAKEHVRGLTPQVKNATKH